MRLARLLVLVAALPFVACSTGNVNGNNPVTTQDISGKWGGHDDQNADSLTATFTQSGGTISGGGVYWAGASKRPVAFAGVRTSDSLHITMPDSSGSHSDTLAFVGIVSKDSFGDELVGLIGTKGTTTVGTPFTLHRRP